MIIGVDRRIFMEKTIISPACLMGEKWRLKLKIKTRKMFS